MDTQYYYIPLQNWVSKKEGKKQGRKGRGSRVGGGEEENIQIYS
jgi:hypothetical protein